MADEQLVYLDTSAFVKLAIPEPETAALIAAIPAKARLVASEILEVEALRATRRVAGKDGATAARTQLAGVRLLPLTDQIRRRACELEPATLRSLDAIPRRHRTGPRRAARVHVRIRRPHDQRRKRRRHTGIRTHDRGADHRGRSDRRSRR